MKSESIKHITDRGTLEDLYGSLFVGRDVFLRTDGINLKVDFVRFREGRVYLDIPSERYEFKRSAIYTRNSDEVAISHLIPFSRDEGYYVFETEGSQIFFAPRRESRLTLHLQPEKKSVISQIISSFVIKESLLQNQARIDWIRHEIGSRIKPEYTLIRIYFLGDCYSDTRMSLIMEDRNEIFIPDINENNGREKTDDSMEQYLREIYYHDTSLSDKEIISEITVPLMYKMMMPFGYIQVNHTGPLTDNDLFMLKRLAMAYSESMSKDLQFFRPSADTIAISDLSMSGLGMVFREKSLARHFREEALVIFTAYMPEGRQASILCRVANITLSGETYRIGCIIEDIDTQGEEHYRGFLTSP